MPQDQGASVFSHCSAHTTPGHPLTATFLAIPEAGIDAISRCVLPATFPSSIPWHIRKGFISIATKEPCGEGRARGARALFGYRHFIPGLLYRQEDGDTSSSSDQKVTNWAFANEAFATMPWNRGLAFGVREIVVQDTISRGIYQPQVECRRDLPTTFWSTQSHWKTNSIISDSLLRLRSLE